MLEAIRSGAQSFGVKVAFGIIILVFVFWGIGNFNDRDYSNVVAVVNGEPILAREFERAYHTEEEYLLRNNPGLTRQQLSKMDLGSRVLNELIRLTLLNQEAQRAGVTVTPRELREVIGQDKSFQDENGKFSGDIYKRVLEARRITPGQYEKELSTQMLGAKLAGLVTAGTWVDGDEARRMFDFLRQRRIIDYLFIPAEHFKAEINIPESEAKDWYDQNNTRFSTPLRVDVEYIRVLPEELVDMKSISENAAREWYEKNKSRFERQERIHARHILVPLAKNAGKEDIKAAEEKLAEAQRQLSEGKAFAEVADAINEPGAAGKGGDLDWLTRGQTVPEFEEVVFSLPEGKISAPFRTDFGLHLALVEARQPAGVASFEEVSQEAYKALAFEEGSDKLAETLDNLIEDNILQKPFAESAARFNLKPAKSGLLDKGGLIEKLGVKPEGADALLSIPAGSPLDTALETGDGYLVARVLQVEPAGIKPFAEVKKEIVETLLAQAALKKALENGMAQLKKYEKEDPAALEKAGFKSSPPLERQSRLSGFVQDEKLINGIFENRVNAWLPAPVSVTNDKEGAGALIARVMKIIEPDASEFAGAREVLENAIAQDRKSGIFHVFIEKLYNQAVPIKVNKDIIDQIAKQG